MAQGDKKATDEAYLKIEVETPVSKEFFNSNGHVYKVTTPTGTIVLGTKKYAGSYISNGTSWVLFGYKQASVINQPLSGFTLPSTASAVTSSDSILSAVQKIQKQLKR